MFHWGNTIPGLSGAEKVKDIRNISDWTLGSDVKSICCGQNFTLLLVNGKLYTFHEQQTDSICPTNIRK